MLFSEQFFAVHFVVQVAVQLVDGVAMLEDNLHFSWKGVVLSVVVSEVSFFT